MPLSSFGKTLNSLILMPLPTNCMIRYKQPRVIIEIGAGYSSLIAAQALRDNTIPRELILIEPHPSEKLNSISPKPKLVKERVQEVPLSFFDRLEDNDILLIDSSHTVKAAGNCPYIYPSHSPD